jgi:hypothetical protein
MLDFSINSSIANLDLSPIKHKLLKEGIFQNQEQLLEAEQEYKLFLHLCQKYPQESLGISKNADSFWHYHILDTKKYMEDCNNIFGHYLHHNPNLFEGSDELNEIALNTERIKNSLKSTQYVGCARLAEYVGCARLAQSEYVGCARLSEYVGCARVA